MSLKCLFVTLFLQGLSSRLPSSLVLFQGYILSGILLFLKVPFKSSPLSGFYSFRYPFVRSFQFISAFSRHSSLRRGRGVLFLFPHSSFGSLFYHRTTPGKKFPGFSWADFSLFSSSFSSWKECLFQCFFTDFVRKSLSFSFIGFWDLIACSSLVSRIDLDRPIISVRVWCWLRVSHKRRSVGSEFIVLLFEGFASSVYWYKDQLRSDKDSVACPFCSSFNSFGSEFVVLLFEGFANSVYRYKDQLRSDKDFVCSSILFVVWFVRGF